MNRCRSFCHTLHFLPSWIEPGPASSVTALLSWLCHTAYPSHLPKCPAGPEMTCMNRIGAGGTPGSNNPPSVLFTVAPPRHVFSCYFQTGPRPRAGAKAPQSGSRGTGWGEGEEPSRRRMREAAAQVGTEGLSAYCVLCLGVLVAPSAPLAGEWSFCAPASPGKPVEGA